MTKPQSSLTALECPRCPRCQARMPLVSTEPTRDGHQRTFRCANCDEGTQSKLLRIPWKVRPAGSRANWRRPP